MNQELEDMYYIKLSIYLIDLLQQQKKRPLILNKLEIN
jgi:hypothetical protein